MGTLLLTPIAGSRPVPANPLSGTSQSWPLLDGDAGTEQTIDVIRAAWRKSQMDPYVRATALRILHGTPPNDDYGEAKRIFEWVLRNIRFTKDPVDFETVSDAKWTLAHRAGDCDDINAVLLPALLGATGHPVRLVTIANQPGAPKQFSHVYAEVYVNGRWIPVDAARRNARFGVAPSRYYRKRVWSLTERRYQDVPGGLNGQSVRLGFSMEDFMKVIQTGTEATRQIISSVTGRTYIPAPPPPGPGMIAVTPTAAGGYQLTSGLDRDTLILLGIAGITIFALSRR